MNDWSLDETSDPPLASIEEGTLTLAPRATPPPGSGRTLAARAAASARAESPAPRDRRAGRRSTVDGRDPVSGKAIPRRGRLANRSSRLHRGSNHPMAARPPAGPRRGRQQDVRRTNTMPHPCRHERQLPTERDGPAGSGCSRSPPTQVGRASRFCGCSGVTGHGTLPLGQSHGALTAVQDSRPVNPAAVRKRSVPQGSFVTSHQIARDWVAAHPGTADQAFELPGTGSLTSRPGVSRGSLEASERSPLRHQRTKPSMTLEGFVIGL